MAIAAQTEPRPALNRTVTAATDALRAVDLMPKVFVVGCAKSGTTWVMNILNAHPAVVIDGEGALGWRLLPELAQAAKRFNQHQQQYGHGAHTHITEAEFAALFRFAVCQRLAAYIERSGKDPADLRLVGDKTPQHTVVMTQLAASCPDARFIHIVRDPRDAATSAWFHFAGGSADNAGKDFAAYASEFIAGPWSVGVSAAIAASRQLPGRVHHIRYEDLHAAPDESIGAMLRFLDLDASPRAVGPCIEASRFERWSDGRARGDGNNTHFYRKGVVGDWAAHMTAEQADACCRPVGDLMRQFRYSAVD